MEITSVYREGSISQKSCKRWIAGQSPSLIAQPSLHTKKIMLCVWWNSERIVHYKLLKKISISEFKTLDRTIGESLLKIQPKKNLFFLHDNGCLDTSKQTKEKTKKLGLDVLPHPPYSPDLAPNDYHFLHFVQQNAK